MKTKITKVRVMGHHFDAENLSLEPSHFEMVEKDGEMVLYLMPDKKNILEEDGASLKHFQRFEEAAKVRGVPITVEYHRYARPSYKYLVKVAGLTIALTEKGYIYEARGHGAHWTKPQGGHWTTKVVLDSLCQVIETGKYR